MNAHRLKPSRFHWPPVFYAAAIALAFLLERLFNLSIAPSSRDIFLLSGGLMIVLALALELWSVRTLWRHHTSVMPYKRANRLVTDGPYRLSRNPSYLGYTMLTIGIGLVTASPWFLVAALTAAFFTTSMAIRCEEMHLLSRFGADFEHYCQQTRRWI